MSRQQYAKVKGRSAETDVVAFLRSLGIEAERRRLAGAGDLGDISGWRGVVVEVKACKQTSLAAWADECATETTNATREFGVEQVGLVIAKRRGRSDVKDWYAILPSELAIEAIKALLEKRHAAAI